MIYTGISVKRTIRPYFIIFSVLPLSSSSSIYYNYRALSRFILYVTCSESSNMIQHWTRPKSSFKMGLNTGKSHSLNSCAQQLIVNIIRLIVSRIVNMQKARSGVVLYLFWQIRNFHTLQQLKLNCNRKSAEVTYITTTNMLI